MRFALKLLAILVLTLVCQFGIEGGGGAMDQVCFMLRAYCDHVRGVPANDPALLQAARELSQRQWAREEHLSQVRCNATGNAPPPPPPVATTRR